eukprot:s43_g30.t2
MAGDDCEPCREYVVEVDRTHGDKLGIDVAEGEDPSDPLVIIGLKDGLIESWNCQRPGQEVRLGHRLVEVNGFRGTAPELKEAKKSHLTHVSCLTEPFSDGFRKLTVPTHLRIHGRGCSSGACCAWRRLTRAMEINLRASQSWKPEVVDAPDLDLPDLVATAETCFPEKTKNQSWESAETTVGEEKFCESDSRSAPPCSEPASTDPGWLNTTLDSMNSCNAEEEEDFDDPEATLGSIARQKRKQQEKVLLENFFRKHKFIDVNKPRQGTNYFALPKKEVMYPIHVAVETKDAQILRLLLARGADVHQETDRGRNAFDVAYDSDQSGSHREVNALLKGAGRKARSVREFMQRNKSFTL